jgi:hypothetical protein
VFECLQGTFTVALGLLETSVNDVCGDCGDCAVLDVSSICEEKIGAVFLLLWMHSFFQRHPRHHYTMSLSPRNW